MEFKEILRAAQRPQISFPPGGAGGARYRSSGGSRGPVVAQFAFDAPARAHRSRNDRPHRPDAGLRFGISGACPCGRTGRGRSYATDLWRENAAITATALLFAATDAGLASCWVHVNGRPCLKDQPDGAQAEDYLREFLPVPAEHGILCAVALGYSDFEPAALPPFDAGTHIHWPEK